MPEGDTVFRAARLLDRSLSGHPLLRTDFRVPELATSELAGRSITETVSRGKHLLTRFDTGVTLHTHLKMEGAWRVLARGARWPRPAHQARVVLETHNTQAVGFSLGVVELLPTAQEDEAVGHLGPDLLGPDWDLDRAVANLLREPERTVIEALLDQRNLAGIGNMYAAELCFLAGIQPGAPVAAVLDPRRLLSRAHQMLTLNSTRAVQSTTGDLRRGRRTWVYRQDGSGCRRCGSRISVTMLGDPGRERAAYWCASCQRT